MLITLLHQRFINNNAPIWIGNNYSYSLSLSLAACNTNVNTVYYVGVYYINYMYSYVMWCCTIKMLSACRTVLLEFTVVIHTYVHVAWYVIIIIATSHLFLCRVLAELRGKIEQKQKITLETYVWIFFVWHCSYAIVIILLWQGWYEFYQWILPKNKWSTNRVKRSSGNYYQYSIQTTKRDDKV